MRKLSLEVQNLPEGKAASLYDQLKAQYKDTGIKMRQADNSIEYDWEIIGASDGPNEVIISKTDKTNHKVTKAIPLKEFLALQESNE